MVVPLASSGSVFEGGVGRKFDKAILGPVNGFPKMKNLNQEPKNITILSKKMIKCAYF